MKEIARVLFYMVIGFAVLSILTRPIARIYGWFNPGSLGIMSIIVLAVACVFVAGIASRRSRYAQRTVLIAAIIATCMILGLMRYVGLWE
jgi:hypothetical protein